MMNTNFDKLKKLLRLNAFENNDNEIVELLNLLIESGEYKKNLEMIYLALTVTEMYGFLTYLTPIEQKQFLDYDFLKSQTYRGSTIEFMNRGQLSFLYELQKNDNIFFSAPTSFGKTSLVLEYIIKNHNILNRVLIIVPTNSLLEELYIKLIKMNKKFDLGYKITGIDFKKYDFKSILIFTPERYLLYLENNEFNDFDLIIMDESYKIVEYKQENISDFINNRSLRFRKVADLIGTSNNQTIYLSPYTDVNTPSMIDFMNEHNIRSIDRTMEFVNKVTIPFYKAGHKDYINVENTKWPTTIIDKTILLMKGLEQTQNIIYIGRVGTGIQIIRKSENNFNSSDTRYNIFLEHLINNYTVSDSFEWIIIEGLKKGIGLYYAHIPRYIKKELVSLFNRRIINNLIVTTAFTEGVNTTAANLIFTTFVNGPNNNPLSDLDILNVVGRAGRFSENNVGKIYCLSEKIKNRIDEIKLSSLVKLENKNYAYSNNDRRIDYEIEMMDNKYLNNYEVNEKTHIYNKMLEFRLSAEDLNISLNVSNKWKLILFQELETLNKSELIDFYQSNIDVLNPESKTRVKSITHIFETIQNLFTFHADVNLFPMESYEIKPFDQKNKFIWGRLYKLYLSGSTKSVIHSNMIYINSKFEKLKSKYNFKDKKEAEYLLRYDRYKWILNYYSKDLSLNNDKFFTETFKFISNIVQYKIPFYLTFSVSILKLYIKKNNIEELDETKLDSADIYNQLEKTQYYKRYPKMVDYGIYNDLLIKLEENKIEEKDILEGRPLPDLLDEYEKVVLTEFRELYN